MIPDKNEMLEELFGENGQALMEEYEQNERRLGQKISRPVNILFSSYSQAAAAKLAAAANNNNRRISLSTNQNQQQHNNMLVDPFQTTTTGSPALTPSLSSPSILALLTEEDDDTLLLNEADSLATTEEDQNVVSDLIMMTSSDENVSLSENSSVNGDEIRRMDKGRKGTLTADQQQKPTFNGNANKWRRIECSEHAKNTINPIRSIVDLMNVKHNPQKELIRLNIGDPTVSGVLPTHPSICQAVTASLASGKYNGYGPATGFVEVRQAVADSVTCSESPVTADDVVLTSGCSHALQLAIEALADPGQNILVPRPGFPLYTTLMRPLGVHERYYDLLPERGWEADLERAESLIDENTAAIIVNNPNNPCGAVYTKEHLQDILRLAEFYRLPVIADEIYGNMIYGGAKFYPMATLRPKVPVLTCDGISKRYLVPGWRLGWVIVHDVDGSLSDIRSGIRQLAQKIVGPSSLIQGALPAILKNTPQEFFDHTRRVLSANADAVYDGLAKAAPGLTPVRAYGAMYIMVGVKMASFPAFRNELEFTQALLAEESVYCLPGSAFNYPGAIRIVLTNRLETMIEACRRIREFCLRHYSSNSGELLLSDNNDEVVLGAKNDNKNECNNIMS